MKLTLIFASVLLVLNIAIGLVLGYPGLNIGINCGIVLITTVLLICLFRSRMPVPFQISLSGLFSSLGLAMLIVGFLIPSDLNSVIELPPLLAYAVRLLGSHVSMIVNNMKGNVLVVAICLALAFEILAFATCYIVSKANEKDAEDRYLIKIKDSKRGPYPVKTLLSLVESGQANVESLCWKHGMAEWQPLKNLPGVESELVRLS
jgi:hypothetical protein